MGPVVSLAIAFVIDLREDRHYEPGFLVGRRAGRLGKIEFGKHGSGVLDLAIAFFYDLREDRHSKVNPRMDKRPQV